MGFLTRLLGVAVRPAQAETASIPDRFFLQLPDLRIEAQFLEVPPSEEYETYSIGYAMTGPRGGQYGLSDDASVASWRKAGLLLTRVAGVSFRSHALQRMEFLPSNEVALVPEPGNRNDRNAVGVWDLHQGMQLGYLPREVAALRSFSGHRGYVFRQYRDADTNAVLGLRLVLGPGLALDIPDA